MNLDTQIDDMFDELLKRKTDNWEQINAIHDRLKHAELNGDVGECFALHAKIISKRAANSKMEADEFWDITGLPRLNIGDHLFSTSAAGEYFQHPIQTAPMLYKDPIIIDGLLFMYHHDDYTLYDAIHVSFENGGYHRGAPYGLVLEMRQAYLEHHKMETT